MQELIGMELSRGNVMFLIGLFGVTISVILLLVCIAVFPIRRKRMLEKLKKED